MNLIAIDPGTTESAYVSYDSTERKILGYGKARNEMVLEALKRTQLRVLVIEMLACYGMPVGKSVFETALWIGRFIQAWDRPYNLLYRREVKMHLCGSVKAKDSNIRQALIDKFGSPGTKKNQGKTYGIAADVWAALGVAVTFVEVNNGLSNVGLNAGTPGGHRALAKTGRGNKKENPAAGASEK